MVQNILYWLASLIATATCAMAKVGIGKTLCEEYQASRISGLSSRAYKQGHFETCYELLEPYLSVQDDHICGSLKYQLAILFYHGHGVTLNRSVANRLFGEAAELGNTEAQQYLSQYDGPYNTRT